MRRWRSGSAGNRTREEGHGFHPGGRARRDPRGGGTRLRAAGDARGRRSHRRRRSGSRRRVHTRGLFPLGGRGRGGARGSRSMSAQLAPLPPQAVVIFGASGDLTRRKLLPAFFHLFVEGLLPKGFALVGFATTKLSNEEFRERARAAIREFAKH